MLNFIRSTRISEQAGHRVWIKVADHDLPFFRIAWGYAPWGSWIGLN